jgi:hypothetical protein
MKQRRIPAIYAGCMWLALAVFLAVVTLFALGVAGWAGALFLIPVALSLVMAAALWAGRGGRMTVVVSLGLGATLTLIGLIEALLADPSAASANVAIALLGSAITLSSAVAVRAYRRPAS